MTQLVGWLSSNTAVALGIMGSAVAFIVSTALQIFQRRAEAREREFQAFHRLVKELVSPDEGEKMWIDRQAAVAFELRSFKGYYEFTERMLVGLRAKWAGDQNAQYPRLLDEVDLTLSHIKKRK